MNPQDLFPLIRNVCQTYEVPEPWVKSIIHQESQWNIHALRYEVNYSYLYQPEKFKRSLISLSTEIATQKTSWGLGQLMGAVAREQGHQGFMAELLVPEINITHICLKIISLMKVSTQKEDIFAMYNGGRGALRKRDNKYLNKQYVDSVNRYLQLYKE